MIREILLVALGGAVGSAARYVVSRYVGETVASVFPWPTFAVNIVGCLIIGLLSTLVSAGTLTPAMKLILITGFCGGFTTFSTFANENLSLMRTGDMLVAALYIGLSMICGIIAAYVGMKIGRL